MQHQTTNDAPRAPMVTSHHKKAYAKPLLTTYGGVRQFTQGSSGANGDGKGSKRTNK